MQFIKISISSITLLLALIFLSIIFIYSKDNAQKLSVSEIRELKDFAFCKCLKTEFKSDSNVLYDGTSDAIIQLGSLGFESYGIINKYVKNYLDTLKYDSDKNHRLGILKCINLYHDKYLDSVIKEIEFTIIEEKMKESVK